MRRSFACAFVVFALVSSGCRSARSAGFWYGERAMVLRSGLAGILGGPLTGEEQATIERESMAEVRRAFAGLNIEITASPQAFWRVQVVPTLGRRGALPASGASVALGMLGGSGAIGFDIVALNAARYARPGAPRQEIVDGIGRGIGRVAIHELGHQILGTAAMHDETDRDSYEYPSPERASQYYGRLHWTLAWHLLQQKLGA